MLYSTLFAAAAAFAGVVSAQNNSDSDIVGPNGPCCTVDPANVPSDRKESWCDAQRNTCRQLCGSNADLASNGNECDDDTLEWSCECKNGTEPDLGDYQQTVPGQMCFYWFNQCINATGDNLDEQTQCLNGRETCGNITVTEGDDDDEESASGSGTSGASQTGGGSEDASGTASGDSADSTGAAAIAFAREFGTPVFAGGVMALLGFAL